ncbi:hypothetical protein YC2023_032013 [Brassica napus]
MVKKTSKERARTDTGEPSTSNLSRLFVSTDSPNATNVADDSISDGNTITGNFMEDFSSPFIFVLFLSMLYLYLFFCNSSDSTNKKRRLCLSKN